MIPTYNEKNVLKKLLQFYTKILILGAYFVLLHETIVT